MSERNKANVDSFRIYKQVNQERCYCAVLLFPVHCEYMTNPNLANR